MKEPSEERPRRSASGRVALRGSRGLTTERLERFAARALENAFDLHDDSIHLYKRGSFGSALSLSVLAAEEVGKFIIVENVAFQSVFNGPWTDDEKVEWLLPIFDHRSKQGKFLGVLDPVISDQLLSLIRSGRMERDKQQGFYVGLPRARRNIDIAARLTTPRQVGRARVERQISRVNDCLVSLCLGCSSETLGFDVPEVEEWLTISLARRLNRRWPRMGKEALRFARQVAPEWARRRA
jgi:AbiV family abortive infection protein